MLVCVNGPRCLTNNNGPIPKNNFYVAGRGHVMNICNKCWRSEKDHDPKMQTQILQDFMLGLFWNKANAKLINETCTKSESNQECQT